jgi:hypothetical protein
MGTLESDGVYVLLTASLCRFGTQYRGMFAAAHRSVPFPLEAARDTQRPARKRGETRSMFTDGYVPYSVTDWCGETPMCKVTLIPIWL